ncbi:hypothetical protein GQX74_011185 [Glossina fuscipes]|nr:hypothetical protein GQX74_011185 [Glossina fuscipes]
MFTAFITYWGSITSIIGIAYLEAGRALGMIVINIDPMDAIIITSFAIRTQKQRVSSDIPHKMLKLGHCAHIDMGLIDFSFNGVFRVTYFLINSKTTWEIIFLKYFIFIVSLPRPVNSSEMTCINTGPYAYISVIKISVGFHLNLCSKSIVLLEELNNEQVDKTYKKANS